MCLEKVQFWWFHGYGAVRLEKFNFCVKLRWSLKLCIFDHSFKGANTGCCLPAACLLLACCLPAACLLLACCLLLLAAACCCCLLLLTCCLLAACCSLLLACCLLLLAAYLLLACCLPACLLAACLRACLLACLLACCLLVWRWREVRARDTSGERDSGWLEWNIAVA